MAVGYRSHSNTGNSTSSTSRAPAVPTGAAAGDVVVVFLHRWESINPVVTAPSGFTRKAQYTAGDGVAKIDVWWKRLTGSDAGTYSFSWTGSMFAAAHAICMTGVVSTGDPIEAINNWFGTAPPFGSTSVTTATIPGLLWYAYNDTGGTHTPPTSPVFTELADADCDTSAYRLPGTTGTFTVTGGTTTGGDSSAAVLVALAAEPAGGTDLNLSDTPGAVRAGVNAQTVAIGVALTDQPAGATRAHSNAGTVAVGRVLTDTGGAVRSAGTVDTVAVGVAVTDPSVGGTRAGSTGGETATTALILTDPHAGSVQAGSTADTVTIDVLYADTAGAIRAGSTADIAASGLTLVDLAGSAQAGATTGETATSALVILDPNTGQIRAGSVGGESITQGTGLTDPYAGAVRLGSTTDALITGLLWTDTPGGVRLGATTDRVAAALVLTDTAGAARTASGRTVLVAAGPVTRGSMGAIDRATTGMQATDRAAPAMTATERPTTTMGG